MLQALSLFRSPSKVGAGGAAAPNTAFVWDAPPVGVAPHNSALERISDLPQFIRPIRALVACLVALVTGRTP